MLERLEHFQVATGSFMSQTQASGPKTSSSTSWRSNGSAGDGSMWLRRAPMVLSDLQDQVWLG